jgi:hypothetical protein
MKSMALAAFVIAAAAGALSATAAAQMKVITMPDASAPPQQAPAAQSCPAPNPTVLAGNDRQAAQLADIDHQLAAIAYYLCLIEGDLSVSKAKPE